MGDIFLKIRTKGKQKVNKNKPKEENSQAAVFYFSRLGFVGIFIF